MVYYRSCVVFTRIYAPTCMYACITRHSVASRPKLLIDAAALHRRTHHIKPEVMHHCTESLIALARVQNPHFTHTHIPTHICKYVGAATYEIRPITCTSAALVHSELVRAQKVHDFYVRACTCACVCVCDCVRAC